MAGTATPIFPQTVKNFVAKIVPADATNLVTLITGGVNGTRIDSIMVSSTDTAAKDLQFVLTVSAVDYIIATMTIPLTSGHVASVSAVDILRHARITGLALDAPGNKILLIASGAVLKMRTLTTVTAAKEIAAFAQGGDY